MSNNKEKMMKKAFASATYTANGIMAMSKEASSVERIAEVMGEYLSKEGVEFTEEELREYVGKEFAEKKEATKDYQTPNRMMR